MEATIEGGGEEYQADSHVDRDDPAIRVRPDAMTGQRTTIRPWQKRIFERATDQGHEKLRAVLCRLQVHRDFRVVEHNGGSGVFAMTRVGVKSREVTLNTPRADDSV